MIRHAALLVLLSALWTAPAAAELTARDARPFTAAMRRHGLLEGIAPQCWFYVLVEENLERIEVNVHTRAGRGCRTAPGIAPRLHSLVYEKQTRRVFLRDFADDRLVPLP